MKRASVFASFSFLLFCILSCNSLQAGAATVNQTRSPSSTLQPSSVLSTLAQTSSPTTHMVKHNSTTGNQTAITTVQPNNINTTLAFVPKLCEVNTLDNSSLKTGKGNILLNWLPSNPVVISQENMPIDLKCKFCLRKPMAWTKILWYKDKPVDPNGEVVSANTLHIADPNNNASEGLYKCTVVTPDNQTVSTTTTLIVNKNPRFSMIPSILVQNETFSQSTLISWLVRGHGIFDSVKVVVKVRQLDSPIWEYKRYYVQYISGSTELQDLIPSTEYIVNITTINENGVKEECRCVTFWSNAWNSTGYDCGILGFSFSTRRTLGLVFGVLGLLFTLTAIFCCVVHPICELRSHQGYSVPDDEETIKHEDNQATNQSKTKGSSTDYCRQSSNYCTCKSQTQNIKL